MELVVVRLQPTREGKATTTTGLGHVYVAQFATQSQNITEFDKLAGDRTQSCEKAFEESTSGQNSLPLTQTLRRHPPRRSVLTPQVWDRVWVVAAKKPHTFIGESSASSDHTPRPKLTR